MLKFIAYALCTWITCRLRSFALSAYIFVSFDNLFDISLTSAKTEVQKSKQLFASMVKSSNANDTVERVRWEAFCEHARNNECRKPEAKVRKNI
jgi:hypothetical protein